MKRKLFSVILLSFFFSVIYAQNKMPLVGTWKLLNGKMTNNDTTTSYTNTNESIKIVTPTHFAVISQHLSDSAFNHTLAGTVKMDAKNYAEEIKYGSAKSFIGKTAKFTYRLEGDKWYIKGGFDKIIFEEEWQRVQ